MTGCTDNTTRRVRRWIVATLVGVAVASIGLAMFTTVTTGQRNAVGAADEIMERIGDRTADLVSAELGDARRRHPR
jgi:hypothetical protein